MLLSLAVLVGVLVYYFMKHQGESAFANPAIELLQQNVVDSLRDQYKTMRKESWRPKPTDPNNGSSPYQQQPAAAATATPAPPPPPIDVGTRQLQHEGRQRKEHRKQKKSSFAR